MRKTHYKLCCEGRKKGRKGGRGEGRKGGRKEGAP